MIVGYVLTGECATAAGRAADFALAYLCRALHSEETALPFLPFRRRSNSHEHNDALISNGRQLIQRGSIGISSSSNSNNAILVAADDAADFVANKQWQNTTAVLLGGSRNTAISSGAITDDRLPPVCMMRARVLVLLYPYEVAAMMILGSIRRNRGADGSAFAKKEGNLL